MLKLLTPLEAGWTQSETAATQAYVFSPEFKNTQDVAVRYISGRRHVVLVPSLISIRGWRFAVTAMNLPHLDPVCVALISRDINSKDFEYKTCPYTGTDSMAPHINGAVLVWRDARVCRIDKKTRDENAWALRSCNRSIYLVGKNGERYVLP